MKKFLTLLSVSVILAGIVSTSFALTAQQIMDKVVNENSKFKNQKVEMKMYVQQKNMPEKQYKLVIYVYNNGQKKYAFVRFNYPQSIKGMSLLSLGKDKEYLYMPAYHRMQRIAGSSKNSKFAGSDFTYSDLSLLYSQKEDGKYTLLADNSSEYVVRIIPSVDESQYSKIVMTIDKSHFLPTKIEFYKDGKLYKTMKNSGLENVDGRWLFKNITLNMADGSSKTTIVLEKTEFNLDIPSSFFSVRTLFMPILRY